MGRPDRRPRKSGEGPLRIFVSLALDETDAELLDSMRRIKAEREKDARTEAFCLIGDCDDDSRQLWDIPEARALCRRAFDIGLASYLDVFGKDWFRGGPEASCALGAFEMWMIAEGRIGPTFTLNKELLDEFFAALRVSNGQADKGVGPMPVPENN